MVPSPDLASISFWVLLVPAFFLGVFIHELGHAVAGSLAGFRIATCGMGIRAPFLSGRLFGVCFYLGWPFSIGLTLALPEKLQPSRGAFVVLMAGGIVANLLTALGAALAWQAGARWSMLAGLFYISLFFGLISLFPYGIKTPTASLSSDGMQIIRYLRGTTGYSPLPGERLATMEALRDLCIALDAYHGTVNMTLGIAASQAGLSDFEGARATLADPCLGDTRRSSFSHVLERFVRAALALEAGEPDARAVLERALEALPIEPHKPAALSLVHAALLHREGNKEAARAAAEEALEVARRSKQRELEVLARAQIFEIDPPKDLLSACRSLLAAEDALRMDPSTILRTLAFATSQLVARGEVEGARALFARSIAAITAVGASIRAPATRERFLAAASTPLREALAEDRSAIPLFIPAISSQGAGAPSEARASAWSVRRSVWVPAVLVVVLIGGGVGAIARNDGTRTRQPQDRARRNEPLSARMQETMDRFYASHLDQRLTAVTTLREGDADMAAEFIEDEIDSSLGMLVDGPWPNRRQHGHSPELIAALRRVREYREVYPRITEDPRTDEEVAKALSLADDP